MFSIFLPDIKPETEVEIDIQGERLRMNYNHDIIEPRPPEYVDEERTTPFGKIATLLTYVTYREIGRDIFRWSKSLTLRYCNAMFSIMLFYLRAHGYQVEISHLKRSMDSIPIAVLNFTTPDGTKSSCNVTFMSTYYREYLKHWYQWESVPQVPDFYWVSGKPMKDV